MQKERLGKARRGVVLFAQYASGYVAIKPMMQAVASGRDMLCAMWQSLDANRKPIENDSFADACRRHNVTAERLEAIKTGLLVCKRTAWLFFVMSVCLLFIGIYAVLVVGRTNWAIKNMVLMAFFSMFLTAMLVFKYDFRLWQCQTKNLGAVRDYLLGTGNGFLRMLKF